MTDAEADELIRVIRETTAELVKSKEACWEFLIRAGIETEESRRKHEAKEKKRSVKNDLSSTLSSRRIFIKGYFLPRPIHAFNPHLRAEIP